jgi:hypothetical protein
MQRLALSAISVGHFSALTQAIEMMQPLMRSSLSETLN